jgi:hypothetical protein
VKRLLKALALMGLALLPLAPGCGGETKAAPTIVVDSTADVEGRDQVLTLREAILLATGELTPADLDVGEADNVTGIPGAMSADTIVFDASAFPLAEPAIISLDSSLPSLSTGSDSVDGSEGGVIVDGRGTTDGFDCFPIDSSDNAISGLQIQNCRTGVVIGLEAQRNVIGGSAGPNSGNVISGNTHVGIEVSGDSNVIAGNYIGTDATGSVSVPNGMEGVWIAPGGENNVVGGSTPGERNVISGNRLFGVSISGPGASGNVVKGNYIGVDATGGARLANRYGVAISRAAQNNTVGGTGQGERNVISGNGGGVLIRHSETSGNVVMGNYMGTDSTGSQPLPNAYAVWIVDGAQNNVVGGPGSGEGNLLAENGAGVVVEDAQTTGNTVRGNSIYSNTRWGIHNLNGGNAELEPPALTGTSPVAGSACPGCTVDIYSDSEDEGKVYEGSTIADGEANFTFDGSPSGPNVTATATDGDGNTSEFSQPLPVPTS